MERVIEEIVIEYNLTGECKINVDLVVKLWDDKFYISQWNEQYTLMHQNITSDNFTKSDIKVKISKRQAKEIIVDLDLMPQQSPVFRSGKTWKKI